MYSYPFMEFDFGSMCSQYTYTHNTYNNKNIQKQLRVKRFIKIQNSENGIKVPSVRQRNGRWKETNLFTFILKLSSKTLHFVSFLLFPVNALYEVCKVLKIDSSGFLPQRFSPSLLAKKTTENLEGQSCFDKLCEIIQKT